MPLDQYRRSPLRLSAALSAFRRYRSALSVVISLSCAGGGRTVPGGQADQQGVGRSGTVQRIWRAAVTPLQGQGYANARTVLPLECKGGGPLNCKVSGTQHLREAPVADRARRADDVAVKQSRFVDRCSTSQQCSVIQAAVAYARAMEVRMCDLCRELDNQIDRCRKIESSTSDELMREAVAALIRSYEEDKAKLHRSQSRV